VAEGALVFDKACEMGLEGIVSKRVGSAYWSRRLPELDKGEEPQFYEARAP
jgi:ATP-dependent DNA ligase